MPRTEAKNGAKRSRLKERFAARIAALEKDVDRVRTREEGRLLRVARKAGYFDQRMSNAELMARLAPSRETPPPPSQLNKLEAALMNMKRKSAAEERREDARRKILLGAFLIAQFEQKPDLKAQMQPELERFLDQHRDANVAAGNRELLADFLT